MSKERELLKKWLIECMWRAVNTSLLEETKELLAQPEQEQEPVAWMSINNNGGISIDSYYANHKDYVPLYTAPPKREPLNIEEIHNGLDGNNGYDDRFVDGVRFAEKAHGIGGGE